ncbi:MAG: ribonuclease T2 family protein [Pikeienuella sp.]
MLRLAALALFMAVIGVCGAATKDARADGEPAGEFDYYVMALSWNASWCEREGDGRGAEQCAAKHDHGFTLHGLWPQSEDGWPSFCRSSERGPSKRQTSAMADIMGSGGLAWYQWKKHGRCSGLSGIDYLRLSRVAYEQVNRPEILRRTGKDLVLPPRVIEDAFLEANPDLHADGVTVTCRNGYVQEVRVCLTRDLKPRKCAGNTRRDCSARTAKFPAMR